LDSGIALRLQPSGGGRRVSGLDNGIALRLQLFLR